MYDKAKLGARYTCFECGTRFYDLNRPTPLCPECGTHQGEAPVRDIRALLSSGRKRAAAAATAEAAEEVKPLSTDDDEEEEEDVAGDDDDSDDDDE